MAANAEEAIVYEYECSNCHLRGSQLDVIGHSCPGSSDNIHLISPGSCDGTSSVPESEPSQHYSSFTWNEKCTRLFLQLYEEKKKMFDNPHIKKKNVWEEICCSLRQHGYMLVKTQVENKFKSLMSGYKKAKDHNRQSGNGPKFSPFYKELDEIFATSPDINPVSAASSISGFVPVSPVDVRDSSSSVGDSPPRRRVAKRKAEEQPSWFTKYRVQAQKNHEERIRVLKENHCEKMGVQRELINVMKDLVNKRN